MTTSQIRRAIHIVLCSKGLLGAPMTGRDIECLDYWPHPIISINGVIYRAWF